MPYFTLILMQSLCPYLAVFPEVKITLNVCAQSLFRPRQILPIWLLLGSYFVAKKKKKVCSPKGVEATEPCAKLSGCATYGCCRYETALSPNERHLSLQPEPPDWWRWLSLYRCQGWHFETSIWNGLFGVSQRNSSNVDSRVYAKSYESTFLKWNI